MGDYHFLVIVLRDFQKIAALVLIAILTLNYILVVVKQRLLTVRLLKKVQF